MGGLRPVVAIYSSFLTRAIDQVLLTGGLARSERLVRDVEAGVRALGCGLTAYPGENEMFALVKGVLRVLNGKEDARTYDPEANR